MKLVSSVVFACVGVMGTLMGSEIRVVGSDILSEILTPSFQVYKSGVNNEMKGSYGAMEKVKLGEADVAIVAIPDGNEMPGEEWTCRPLAYEVTVFGVHNTNPLNEIDLKKAAKIFGRPGVNNWGKIGVEGSLAKKGVRAVMMDERSSLVKELFRWRALKGGEFNVEIEFEKNQGKLADILKDREESIVLMNSIPKEGHVLSVLDTERGDEFSFSPTQENVYYGDYPLRVPYYVVYPKGKQDKVEKFVSFLYGKRVQEDLQNGHLYVVPEKVRKRFVEELDKSR